MLDDRREVFYDTHFEACHSRYEDFDELAARLSLELLLTCDIATQLFAQQLSEYGLSKSTFNILMLLRHTPGNGMQLHDLGELLLVSRANITGLIDHLEKKGYVTREVPESDRRVRYARITPKAEALLDRVVPCHLERVGEALQGVSADDKAELRRLLGKIRQSVLECAGGKEARPRAHSTGEDLKTATKRAEYGLRAGKG